MWEEESGEDCLRPRLGSKGGGEDEDEDLSEEQREHKRKFREWRKKHYNEFHAVQRAKALMEAVSVELT